MTRRIIHFDRNQAGKLVCDNPICDYVTPHAQAWGAHLIGKPCPKCSVSLLTVHDYQKTERMFRTFDWLNKWFGWLGSTEEQVALKEKQGKVQRMGLRIHNDQVIIRKDPAP